MKPDQIRQLLGGYATGTLTPDEQKALFDAALQDQSLFDELAREQALKDALDQPGVRRELAQLLSTHVSLRERMRSWLRWQYPVAAGMALAAAAVTIIAIVNVSRKAQVAVPVAQVARVQQPAAEQQRMLADSATARGGGGGGAKQPEVLAPQPKPAKRMERPAFRATKPVSPAAASAGDQAAVQPAAPPAVAAAPPPPLAAKREENAPPSPAQVAESVALARPAQDVVATVRTSLLAEQHAPPGTRARDIFYGAAAKQARSPQSKTFGVVGGYPGAGAGMRPGVGAGTGTNLGTGNAARAATLQPLGLRYATEMSQGAPPRLVVESNADAVLYLFRRTAAGQWLPVTPGGMSLTAHTRATTPPIAIDGAAAPPRTLAVLARQPRPELSATGAELTRILETMRNRADPSPLVQTDAGSTYAVAQQPDRPAILVLAVPVP